MDDAGIATNDAGRYGAAGVTTSPVAAAAAASVLR